MGDRHQGQRGQAIVIVALMMVALIGMAAIAFDAGLAMADRRSLQAAADTAALAGAKQYGQGTSAAHWVAMQYLANALGFGLPVGACTGPSACSTGPHAAGGYSIGFADSTTLVGSLGPDTLDVTLTHAQPSIFARMLGFPTLTTGVGARATPPGPVIIGAVYALAAVSADANINGGGAAFQTVGGAVYAQGSFGANNGPHSTGIPSVQTNYDGTTCPGNPGNHVDLGGGAGSLAYHYTSGSGTENHGIGPPNYFDNDPPTLAQPAPVYMSAAAARDASGNWMPGIYNGVFPSGGTMNPGVYKIINVTSTIALGSITNTIHTPSGTADASGAVALSLDSSDTGALDISQSVLNGIDDLNPPNYGGARDPQGTHNFVIWGGNGPTGYSGSITIGPHAGTDMSGIIYTPRSPYNSNGNSSPQFAGSAFFASMTVNGGGNGQQVFNWVCGLNAVAGAAGQGGLIR